MKKIIIYQKHNENIEIEDNDNSQSLDEYSKSISDIFEQSNIILIKFDKKILISRPSNIQTILVSEENDKTNDCVIIEEKVKKKKE